MYICACRSNEQPLTRTKQFESIFHFHWTNIKRAQLIHIHNSILIILITYIPALRAHCTLNDFFLSYLNCNWSYSVLVAQCLSFLERVFYTNLIKCKINKITSSLRVCRYGDMWYLKHIFATVDNMIYGWVKLPILRQRCCSQVYKSVVCCSRHIISEDSFVRIHRESCVHVPTLR